MSRGTDPIIVRRYGTLTVSDKFWRSRGHTYRLCQCDCGLLKEVRDDNLKNGSIKSCGKCLKFKHNMYGTKPYRCWAAMKQRCNNKSHPRYKDWGGRGIGVCDSWGSFEGFWEDMNKGYRDHLSLDRIDNNGNYCKDNCRWATTKQQGWNRRPGGKRKTFALEET